MFSASCSGVPTTFSSLLYLKTPDETFWAEDPTSKAAKKKPRIAEDVDIVFGSTEAS